LFLSAIALVIFLRIEFRAGMKSLLLSPGEARLRLLARELVEQLAEVPPGGDARDHFVDKVARDNRVTMGLFLNGGGHVAGSLRGVPEPYRKPLTDPRGDREAGRPVQRGPRIEAREPTDFPPPPPGKGPSNRRLRGPEHPVEFFPDFGFPTSTYWFGVRVPVIDPQSPFPQLGTLVIRSNSLLFNPLLFDPWPWIALGVAMGGIMLACWAPWIHSLTRSVQRIHGSAERFARGEFHEKLEVTEEAGRELTDVAGSLNRMATQLDGFVHGQKRFLGDVAHELSAPIARTQAALCILEERLENTPEFRWVEGLREEVDQMSQMTSELMQFSKVGLAGKQKTPLTPVGLRAIAQKAISREVAGRTSGADVTLLPGHEVTAFGNSDLLIRALGNVIRNAIRYAGEAGPITVLVLEDAEEGHAILRVTDHGPGIPDDAVDKIFQPFFRLDTSRSRQSGGAGLGLAIVQSSMESMSGSACCRNRDTTIHQTGLEVDLRIPLASAQLSTEHTPIEDSVTQG